MAEPVSVSRGFEGSASHPWGAVRSVGRRQRDRLEGRWLNSNRGGARSSSRGRFGGCCDGWLRAIRRSECTSVASRSIPTCRFWRTLIAPSSALGRRAAPLHPSRELGRALFLDAGQAQEIEAFGHPVGYLLLRLLRVACERKSDVLADAHRIEERTFLERHAELAAQLVALARKCGPQVHPSSSTVPESGFRRPMTCFKRTLLPIPDCPRRTSDSPSSLRGRDR